MSWKPTGEMQQPPPRPVTRCVCDFCGADLSGEYPAHWELEPSYTFPGCDPETLDFCTLACLRDWIGQQADQSA